MYNSEEKAAGTGGLLPPTEPKKKRGRPSHLEGLVFSIIECVFILRAEQKFSDEESRAFNFLLDKYVKMKDTTSVPESTVVTDDGEA